MHAGLGEFGVGLLPDFRGGLAVEQTVETEVALQLEVRPVVERIAQRVRDGLGPGLKFLARRGVAGDEALVDAVGAQRAPFVVVAAEPEFGEIGELVVVRNEVGRQVTVVIVNRLALREAVVELAGLLRGQEEIVVDQGAGFRHGGFFGGRKREGDSAARARGANPYLEISLSITSSDV